MPARAESARLEYPESAATNDCDARVQQVLLAGFTKCATTDLARVTLAIARSHHQFDGNSGAAAAGALSWSLVPTHGCLGRSVLALIACAFPLFALPANYDGRRIAAIQFDPAKQPFHLDQLKKILGLAEGQILKAGDIASAIQRLYSTGDYADISVDGTPQPDGGIALRFATQPNYFIGSVRVSDVPEPPNRGQLAAAAKLQLGAEYEEHDEGHAVENLQDTLRRNGYYQAVIAPSVTKNPETQQVNFYFAIEPGRRARFGDPVIRGVPEQQKQRIVRASGWKRIFGHFGYTSMTASRVQSGVESVRKYFQNGNHLLAKVTLAKLDYDPNTNRVTPELDIAEGPWCASRRGEPRFPRVNYSNCCQLSGTVVG